MWFFRPLFFVWEGVSFYGSGRTSSSSLSSPMIVPAFFFLLVFLVLGMLPLGFLCLVLLMHCLVLLMHVCVVLAHVCYGPAVPAQISMNDQLALMLESKFTCVSFVWWNITAFQIVSSTVEGFGKKKKCLGDQKSLVSEVQARIRSWPILQYTTFTTWSTPVFRGLHLASIAMPLHVRSVPPGLDPMLITVFADRPAPHLSAWMLVPSVMHGGGGPSSCPVSCRDFFGC